MRYRPWLLGAFVTFGAPYLSKAQASVSNDLATILQRQTQELYDALIPGAASVWDKYLDADVSIATEDGELRHKPDMIEQIKPFPAGISGHIKVTDFHVTQRGTVAVATHIEDEFENYHGHELHCQYRTTDTWVQSNGNWRLLASQVLALRTDPPSVTLTPKLAGSYAGRYALSPEISYEIRLKEGQLEGQQTGRKPEKLLAEAPDLLFVAGKPRYRMLIQRDASGRITGMAERREAWDLVWTRVDR